MKFISTLFIGFSLASLAGCAAEPTQGAWTPQYASSDYASESTNDAPTSEFVLRPLVVQKARFLVAFPCAPKADKHPDIDETPLGTLRSQTYSCRGAGRSTFVAMVSAFDNPTLPSFDEPATNDQPTRKSTDAKIAASVANVFCKELIKKDYEISCTPGSPVDMGGMTDVEVSFGQGRFRFPARVRVAYPYVAAVLAIGKYDWDDLQKALDIKLPAPERSETSRFVARAGWFEPDMAKPFNAFAAASPIPE